MPIILSRLIQFNKKKDSGKMVFAPIPNREVHEGYMRKAIEMAELALASDETPVGCVFVHDGEVIGRGINGTNASLNVLPPLSTLIVVLIECTGHPPRRIRRPSRDHGQAPTIHPQGHRSLRHCRAVHHVRFRIAAIRDPRCVLWVSERSLWRMWRRDEGAL